MTNAQLTKIFTALYDGPRPLAKLLGTTDDARLEEVGQYLTGAGLAYVSVKNGVRVAEIFAGGTVLC
jgi:hypothetical protein